MNTPISHGVIASFIFALSFMLCVINVIPIIIIDINVTPTAIISNTFEINFDKSSNWDNWNDVSLPTVSPTI